MFSDTTLTEIRDRIDIVDLIGEYVELKKAGQSHAGLCPFHGDKSPSFHVHSMKQIFHCFGCHKGGNIFTFLSAAEGISFPDAVKRLAERAGVEIPREERILQKRTVPAKKDHNQERLFAANDWAAKYYHYLLTEVKEYRYALEYLKSRGLNDKAIQKFRIGVSPGGWNTLRDLMKRRGFTPAELEKAGLLIDPDNAKGGYDRFRQRLMFPIRNADGQVLGFGARILTNEENQPKYLNSPESAIFPKRNHLYGMHENQREIRIKGEAIIVEGYMDVIGLYEKGVQNALATMGTALTDTHCETLKSMTRRVVTVFDPDSAGQDAWRRSVHLFLSHGLFAKDLSLPTNQDPDEFVQAEGADHFYELCEKAPRQITKLLKEIAAQGSLSEEQRSKHLQDLTPILMATRHSPDRAILWDSISMVLKVSLEALKELSQPTRASQRSARTPAPSRPFQNSQRSAPAEKEPELDLLDIEFLKLAIAVPDRFSDLSKGEWLEGVRGPKIRLLLERLHDASEEEAREAVLQQVLVSETHSTLLSTISEALIMREQSVQQANTELEAVSSRIRQRRKEAEIKALSAQIKLSQQMGDEMEQLRLLERLKELRTQ